jgi:hypothetical protein
MRFPFAHFAVSQRSLRYNKYRKVNEGNAKFAKLFVFLSVFASWWQMRFSFAHFAVSQRSLRYNKYRKVNEGNAKFAKLFVFLSVFVAWRQMSVPYKLNVLSPGFVLKRKDKISAAI